MPVPAPSSVEIEGRKLAYDLVSPPEPRGTILLLTGLGSKRLGWARQLPVFGREYRTIALDHRGTGDSDPVDQPYSVRDMADDAAAVLDALGIARTHVVGISLGGGVALQFALAHPERLARLILISTTAGGPTHAPASQEILALLVPQPALEVGERARRNYARIMAPGYTERHPEELERIVETARYRPQTPQSYVLQLQAALTHDVGQQLGQIQAPTLVIHGDQDPLVVPANGQYLAQHIPHARLILYPNVGHIPIIEVAAQFNRDVLAFLAG